MSKVELIEGDCLEAMKGIESGYSIITDPPYGNRKYETDIEFNPQLLGAWIARSINVVIFGYPELLVRWCVIARAFPDEWITWWPTNKCEGRAKSKLPKESESIAVFGPTPGAGSIMRPRITDKTTAGITESRGLDVTAARMGDVWRDAAPGMAFNSHLRLHPNEKPLSLMVRLVTLCTSERDTILDPFMGSGTTGVACIQTGRNFIGIEKDAGYFRIAQQRIANAQAKQAASLFATV